MLPEQMMRLLGEEDYNRLSHRLDSIIDNEYFYPRNRIELMQLIAELAALSYKKGRADEQYSMLGPAISLYEKSE